MFGILPSPPSPSPAPPAPNRHTQQPRPHPHTHGLCPVGRLVTSGLLEVVVVQRIDQGPQSRSSFGCKAAPPRATRPAASGLPCTTSGPPDARAPTLPYLPGAGPGSGAAGLQLLAAASAKHVRACCLIHTRIGPGAQQPVASRSHCVPHGLAVESHSGQAVGKAPRRPPSLRRPRGGLYCAWLRLCGCRSI